mgnify:CR=1 FL=1
MRNPMNNEIKILSPEIKSARFAVLSAGILILTALFLSACSGAKKEEAAKAEHTEKPGEHKEGTGEEVSLSPEALAAAKLEFAEVTARAGGGFLRQAPELNRVRRPYWDRSQISSHSTRLSLTI